MFVTEGTWAPGLEGRLRQAGFTIDTEPSPETRLAVVVAGREEAAADLVTRLDDALPEDVPILVQAADQLLAEAQREAGGRGRLVGFDGLFAAAGTAWTLTGPGDASHPLRRRVEAALEAAGVSIEWIHDGAGLVLPRVMAMLANEAAFALAEGTADEETIDRAMRLGANYPVGPLEWMRQIGPTRVLRVLEHLRMVFAEERYRVAPLLRRWAQEEKGK